MKHLAFLKRYALLMSAKDRNAVRAASTGFPAVQAVRQTPCCVVTHPCLYVSHQPLFVCAWLLLNLLCYVARAKPCCSPNALRRALAARSGPLAEQRCVHVCVKCIVCSEVLRHGEAPLPQVFLRAGVAGVLDMMNRRVKIEAATCIQVSKAASMNIPDMKLTTHCCPLLHRHKPRPTNSALHLCAVGQSRC